MDTLINQNCIPIDRNSTGLKNEEIELLSSDVPDWFIVDEDGVLQLHRDFKLKNFSEALTLTNAIGEIAEEQNHHPMITLTWGQVTVRWWTHTVGGLHKNDYIMAAKTSAIYQKLADR